MKFRDMAIEDYEKLIPFWKTNYFVMEMDDLDKLKLFLEKNPKLSVIAEEDGKIVGTALGSFDGRRGYLQKVVVDKNFRKKGVGQQLVQVIIKKLKALGVTYIPIAVEEKNISFYKRCGFNATTQISMNINI